MNLRIGSLLLAAILISSVAWAQNGGIKVQPEDQLTKYLPATVFLDNENVPTQKRNAVLLDVNGKRAVLALIDTTGYSAAYKEKYIGAILTVGGLKIGSSTLPSGTYGFGETKSGEGPNSSVTVHVYDIGGKEVATISTERQADMKGVRPLQVVVGSDGAAQLYLGPYHAPIAPAE
jgi:hypothetical protein